MSSKKSPKSVYSNYLLEKNHTKRVKVLDDEKEATTRIMETKAEAMKATNTKGDGGYGFLYGGGGANDNGHNQYSPYPVKTAKDTFWRGGGSGSKSKKISSKLEFDDVIFNRNEVEREDSKAPKKIKKALPLLKSNSSKKSAFSTIPDPGMMGLNKTKLYGDDVIVTEDRAPESSRQSMSIRRCSMLKEAQDGLSVVGFQRALSAHTGGCNFLKPRNKNPR